MRKSRIIGGIVAALFIGGAGAAFAIAWRPAIAAIDLPAPQSFDTALVKRGRYLAAIGNCNDCHTVRGGRSFAGGLPVPTPFGTIYSSNITPDAKTGIGRWSEAAFRRAMQSGVDRDGQHLYPTFPYDHFTHVSDDDDRALYAYLMTRQPVRASARENDLAFPFNQRIAVAGWKLLFLRHGTYQPDSTKSAEWNRGAYLVEGLAHCGACHTPRNALGAEKTQASFAGGDVDNWHAYAINSQSSAPVPWDMDALFRYLRQGWHPDHGVARGPMAEVVSNLSEVPESDIRAIATYMASVSGATGQWRDHHRRADLCGGLRDLPCHRPRAALWRNQPRALDRPHQPRRAQRRQYRAVGHPSHARRTQPDHARFCRQHDRWPDRGGARLSARAFRQSAAMDQHRRHRPRYQTNPDRIAAARSAMMTLKV